MKTDRKIFPILKLIFIAAAVFVLIMAVLYTDFTYLAANIVNDFTYSKETLPEYSKEQMLADFDIFMDTLETGIPTINEAEKLYGTTFLDKKDKYRRMAEECENNFDFFVLCDAILCDIPNCHTYMCSMQSSALRANRCFKADRSRLFPNAEGIADEWYDYLGKSMSELENVDDWLAYIYIDGHYMNIEFENLDLREEYGEEILEVNGIPITQYAADNMFCSSISYDFANNIPYREVICFNTKAGEPVTALVKYPDGSTKEKTIYYSLKHSTAFMYEGFYCSGLQDYDFEADQIEAAPQDCAVYYDEETDTAYIYITSFNYYSGTLLYDTFTKYANCRNIIIDVRENSGGLTGAWQSNIFVPLYSGKLEIDNTAYIEKNKYNGKLFSNPLAFLIYNTEAISPEELPFETDSTLKWTKFTETAEYTGEYSGDTADRNIYVLCGANSASLTDEFTHYFKKNKLATIIGENNTKGEGIAPTYISSRLPNTGLFFCYSPFVAISSDGKDNSVYGTAPDVYVPITVEDYLINRKLKAEGENTYAYENRLQWDTALKYTLNDIETKTALDKAA